MLQNIKIVCFNMAKAVSDTLECTESVAISMVDTYAARGAVPVVLDTAKPDIPFLQHNMSAESGLRHDTTAFFARRCKLPCTNLPLVQARAYAPIAAAVSLHFSNSKACTDMDSDSSFETEAEAVVSPVTDAFTGVVVCAIESRNAQLIAAHEQSLRKSHVHPLDRGGTSAASGEAAEEAFAHIARAHGFAVSKTYSHIDRSAHVDFVLVDSGHHATIETLQAEHSYDCRHDTHDTRDPDVVVRQVPPLTPVMLTRVDVKAMKPFQRDGPKQCEEMWLELHGFAPMNNGWLFAGKADVIAVEIEIGIGIELEQSKAFVMLDRVRLARFAMERASRAPKTSDATDALYKLYNRAGSTLLMRVLLKDAYDAAGCDVWLEER